MGNKMETSDPVVEIPDSLSVRNICRSCGLYRYVRQVNRLAKYGLATYDSEPQARPYLQLVESTDLAVKRIPTNWNRVGALVAIAVGLSGFVLWYDQSRLPDMITSRTSELNQKVGTLDAKLDLLLETLLKRAATTTGSDIPADLNSARDVLANAKSKNVVLPPQAVIQVGKALVYMDSREPAYEPIIWATATDFLEYRSFLNQRLGSAPFVAGQPNRIGVTYQNSTFSDLVVKLDGIKAVNSLFVDCMIEYEGGSTYIQQVEFDNCKFKIRNNTNGKKLAVAILDTKNVSFDPSVTAELYPH